MGNIGNTVLNICDSTRWSLVSFISTAYMKLILIIRGISYGKSIRFFGITKFKKCRSSKILIGNSCIFRSSHTSNLIGINRPCIITALTPESKLIIGNNCGFSGTVIGCFESIKIGNNVRCGANTLITDSDWHTDDARTGMNKPIVIEDNVWLGVNAIVLKGVTVGANSIIGAGSIVTKNIPEGVIAAGNPCRVIKHI
jgi:acetyltransferase-like isoleucine patch superfamily enzyme